MKYIIKGFGGSWTNRKLNAFINYVKAYTTILNNVKNRYGWKTIYFDGFAGYGEIDIEKEKSNDRPKGFFETHDYGIYQGSVSRVLNLPKEHQFDYYYFVDTNKKYIKKLIRIKANLPKDFEPRVEIRNDDCNNQLKLLSDAMNKKKNFASLILLDPFGMQINWDSIEQFKNTRTDIWILVPTGVAINRLLDKKKKLKRIDKLEKFFGLPSNEIEDIFYTVVSRTSLFGKFESIYKVKDPIQKIADIYINQLKSVWDYVTEKPLILRNSRNCPIFHFIFASNNKTGFKIASDIINSK